MSSGDQRSWGNSSSRSTEEHHAISVQAQRDEEIEEIQKRSKHQPPAIQALPNFRPRRRARR